MRDFLWQTALALTRSHHDADELAQQTITTLLARHPDRADHRGYARQTMLRIWLNQQRSMRRRMLRTARLAAMTTFRFVDRDRVDGDELHERMHQAIDTLPPQQHAALVLRVVEELSYKEIAATLGSSVQTVRANLHLARQRVRKLLGEWP
jgi:RNA polymerase sigma factor (sigma-70 family)